MPGLSLGVKREKKKGKEAFASLRRGGNPLEGKSAPTTEYSATARFLARGDNKKKRGRTRHFQPGT